MIVNKQEYPMLALPEHSIASLDTIHNCDAFALLRSLPSNYVNCIVTSPPYFGLRDYGMAGQIGLEATPQAFVATMVHLFREAKRVLRDDGVLWINLGDSYVSTATSSQGGSLFGKVGNLSKSHQGFVTSGFGIAPKNLLGIPWRVAFGLQDDGWILRSDVIWHKPNPMPESVTDRPTKSHEYVFLFAKNERYWYDADAIRQPITESSAKRYALANGRAGSFSDETGFESDSLIAHENSPQYKRGQGRVASRGNHVDHLVAPAHPNGRNARTVWTIATEPTPFAHFATFPQKLIEPMILAGCPHKVCAVCGAPYVRVTEVEYEHINYTKPREMSSYVATNRGEVANKKVTTLGFEPQCTHAAATRPGITLDPFMGSGTTALVARRLGRHYIGSELNREYALLARERLSTPFTPMFTEMLTA